MTIEFKTYTGKYPNLCSGELTIYDTDANKYYHLNDILISGGCIRKTEDGYKREQGPWSIDINSLPTELQPYYKDILNLVNEHIPYGCCGGCT